MRLTHNEKSVVIEATGGYGEARTVLNQAIDVGTEVWAEKWGCTQRDIQVTPINVRVSPLADENEPAVKEMVRKIQHILETF